MPRAILTVSSNALRNHEFRETRVESGDRDSVSRKRWASATEHRRRRAKRAESPPDFRERSALKDVAERYRKKSVRTIDREKEGSGCRRRCKLISVPSDVQPAGPPESPSATGQCLPAGNPALQPRGTIDPSYSQLPETVCYLRREAADEGWDTL